MSCHPEGVRRAAARRICRLFVLAVPTLLVPAALSSPAAPASPHVENVLVVTLDGLRWQELFSGLDASLNTKEDGGVATPERLAARFDRPTPEARREALLPFVWTVVAREGQVVGEPAKGSLVRVTNGLWFSYPGYSEMLSGAADPRVDSNDKKVNPNLIVLEWLNRRPGFEGRVAAFGSWDVLPFIIAAGRSGLHVNGDGPAVLDPASDRERLLNAFTADLPAYWAGSRFDAPTMQGALEYLRTHQPRVLYVMLGRTDEWAHERRRPLPRRGLALGPVRPPAVGTAQSLPPTAEGRRCPRHRPAAATPAGLDRPRREGARRGADPDGGDGALDPGPRPAGWHPGHPVAARGHGGRAPRRGLPHGLAGGRAPPAGPRTPLSRLALSGPASSG
jgi:hypothetical protein